MKTVIIGIGNPLKRDDNIGNCLVEELSKEVKDKDYVFIKAYLTPENYLLPLKKSKPKRIYVIDAVEFEGSTGEVKLFDLNEMITSKTTTHSIPITFYKHYFPGVEIKLIGVKVKDAGFGEELSKDVKAKFDGIVKEVKRIIISQ
ncbi:MAG: hydrogenase maturation protease [Nanoarchaeota archaeon]|nr:hydrogenase maturation protease [Nanoarchaeota archaeon]